jgi:hypothetical protein
LQSGSNATPFYERNWSDASRQTFKMAITHRLRPWFAKKFALLGTSRASFLHELHQSKGLAWLHIGMGAEDHFVVYFAIF